MLSNRGGARVTLAPPQAGSRVAFPHWEASGVCSFGVQLPPTAQPGSGALAGQYRGTNVSLMPTFTTGKTSTYKPKGPESGRIKPFDAFPVVKFPVTGSFISSDHMNLPGLFGSRS